MQRACSPLYKQIQLLAEEFLKAKNKETRNTIFQELLDVMKPIEVNLFKVYAGYSHRNDLYQDYCLHIYQCLTNYDLSRKVLFATYATRYLARHLLKQRKGYDSAGVASGYTLERNNLSIRTVGFGVIPGFLEEMRDPVDVEDYTVTQLESGELLKKLSKDPLMNLILSQMSAGETLLQTTKRLGITYNDIKYKLKIIKERL